MISQFRRMAVGMAGVSRRNKRFRAGVLDRCLDGGDQVGDELVGLAFGDDGRVRTGKAVGVDAFHPGESGPPIFLSGLEEGLNGADAGLGFGLFESATKIVIADHFAANGFRIAFDVAGGLAKTEAAGDEVADSVLFAVVESFVLAGHGKRVES